MSTETRYFCVRPDCLKSDSRKALNEHLRETGHPYIDRVLKVAYTIPKDDIEKTGLEAFGLWHMEEAGEQVHVTCPFCLAPHACIYLAKTVGIMSCGKCQMELAFLGQPKTESEAREIIRVFIEMSKDITHT